MLSLVCPVALVEQVDVQIPHLIEGQLPRSFRDENEITSPLEIQGSSLFDLNRV